MPKKELGSENPKKDDREIWTAEMDDALVDAFLHQYELGNKVNENFTTLAYGSIVNELNTRIGEKLGKTFSKVKVKNRWKTIKNNFRRYFNLFKNGLSGFAWDSTTETWKAEPEVWKTLIEAHKGAEEWMDKPIKNYEKLVIIYGQDRVTGENAETTKDIKKRLASSNTEDHNIGETSTFNVFNVDESDIHSQIRDGAISSKHKWGKKVKVDEEDDPHKFIKAAIDNVAEAIREGNNAYERVTNRLPIKEGEIWKLLVGLELNISTLKRVYLYLIKHPDDLGAILGCPP